MASNYQRIAEIYEEALLKIKQDTFLPCGKRDWGGTGCACPRCIAEEALIKANQVSWP